MASRLTVEVRGRRVDQLPQAALNFLQTFGRPQMKDMSLRFPKSLIWGGQKKVKHIKVKDFRQIPLEMFS